MNFLSHFYFEQTLDNSYQSCGMLLPDLVKNAHKSFNIYPQKRVEHFPNTVNMQAFLRGWKRHLEVDLVFHHSDFFYHHTAELKKSVLPLLDLSPIRPSFFAHIGLELLLDHLLIVDEKIEIDTLYGHLDDIDEQELHHFLTLSGLNNPPLFFNYFEQFKKNRYLFAYEKIENLSHALRRICLRLWPEDFPESKLPDLTAILKDYSAVLRADYQHIYAEIEKKLLRLEA